MTQRRACYLCYLPLNDSDYISRIKAASFRFLSQKSFDFHLNETARNPAEMEISKFSVQVQCFNLIGFQRISKYPIFARVFQLFNAIIIICGMLPLIFFFMENFCDILAVADALGPNFTGAIALIKVISLCMWKEKFYELMDGIKKLSLNGKLFSNTVLWWKLLKVILNLSFKY